LDRYVGALDAIERGETPAEAPFARVAAAIGEYALPVQLLRDLLDAFRQDVTCKRYADFATLLAYCRRSANPVGRLLLHLFHMTDPQSLRESDAICTSLQLINFWQDVAADWEMGRVYIPREDLERFGVGEQQIAQQRADENWQRLMAFECERARTMLMDGAPLGRRLPGRMGLEIRATVQGGARVLDRIDAVKGDVFRKRPRLNWADWMVILGKAL
jgi:squalene synthase HpnC